MHFTAAVALLHIIFLGLPSFLLSKTEERNFYHFTVMDIHNEVVSLEKYRGKVSLVVNVASQCGYTENHYKSLQLLQDLFSGTKMFNVLAFPCNQFGKQEPGSNSDIRRFATEKHSATFPMFAKVDVLGENALDAWRFLAEKSGMTPDWNFWKYLVDHRGQVIGSWGPKKDPHQLYGVINTAVEKAKTVSTKKKTKKFKKADGEL